MLYKALVHLTVGLEDRSTKIFEAGKFYKEEELGKEVDRTNFLPMSEQQAQNDLAARKQAPLTNSQKEKPAQTAKAPEGDVE